MMTRTLAILLSTAALATAQQKISIPLSEPSQPATLLIRLTGGSLKIDVGPDPAVIVESAGAEAPAAPRPAPGGMHRLDSAGLHVEEDRNIVTVRTPDSGDQPNVTIRVPVNTSMELRSTNAAHIDVTGVNGDLDIQTLNGAVTLTGVTGPVVARSLSGNLTVSRSRTEPDVPLSLFSLTGNIDVTLPADTKASFRISTRSGSMLSDFDLESATSRADSVARHVEGTINGGGPDYVFETTSGNILIHRK